MKRRVMSIFLILGLILSLLANVSPVKAEDPFPSPDIDGDGISNDMETNGWYNLSGGPYVTDRQDIDSDNDGLTDGEEKLFDTNPLDSHSPGIGVRYESSFKTKQYFSTTDPAYLSMKQGGDQYLLTEALVARRGTTFNIVGPGAGTLAITGTGLTALSGIPDPARGGWNVTLPAAGTAGTYTATITDGAWSISMPLYVIFELPTTLPADQVAAFLYDDDPANKKDEVAVFWSMQEWKNWFNCPQPNDGICSDWAYHVATGYAQAFWTEQFTKSVFVNNAILAINGKTTPATAAAAVAAWADTEFRTRSGKVKNSWSTAMNRWNDGTGITMDGGYCETTSTVFTTILRSAGIAARPFTLDYNKTAGHDESGQIGTVYEYDHSVMMWLDGIWKAQRAYNGDEASDVYYPYAHGTTGISNLSNWRTYTGYYSDYYGDTVVSVGAGWDFQNGNNGGGVVNTVWPMTVDQRLTVNQDYYWKSNWPLQITQSPYVDVLNCQLWKGDNWAPGEWRTPTVSNPAGRTAIQSYNLPTGIPDPAAPLENWPYNPRPTACSASTPTDVCNAYKASWTTVCTPLQGQSSDSVSNKSRSDFQVYLPMMDSGGWASGNIVLGDILESRGVDQNGDGRFEELAVKFDVDSSLNGEFQFGGTLLAGESGFNSGPAKVTLQNGKQSVELFFDGQQIRDNAVDGPYQVTALWAAPADQPIPQMIKPENMLAYREYAYETGSFTANQFMNQAAVFGEEITHEGIDADGNGLFESVAIRIPLMINTPGSYTVEGDLYDAQGNFISHESWSGEDAAASLQFNVAKYQPPFTLEHLNLIQSQGQIIDSRFYEAYQVADMAGKVETSTVVLGEASQSEIDPQGVTPNTFTFNPVDTDSDGLFDKLVVNVGVTVTDHGGSYKIEGLLADEYGTKVAWAVSNAQTLVVGSQTMTLEFDGKMLYDQLPLSGTRSFKLVAVKIFSGNLSSATLESEAKSAGSTAAYARSQFEASSSAAKLFEDDINSGGGKWAYTQPIWSLTGTIWNSGPQTWMASISGSSNGQLTTSTALDFTNYADPVLRFDHAYKMTGTGNTGSLQASTDGGTTWTTIKTYTGATTHWMTELVSLSAYSGMPNVKLRFNAQATSSLLWYVDDVFINAWPAVTGASFTYSSPVAGANTTLTASYTSIDTTLPVTYKWDFCGVEQTVTTSNITYAFPNAGNCAVTLTVSNPYDSAVTSQTVNVAPGSGQYTLTVNIPGGGGTVTKSPDRPAYNPGDVVTLTQTTSTGYTWGGWSGACTGTGACTVTMNANKTVTATFTPIEYSLNITVTGTGSVTKSPDQATYHYGDTVQLSAVPGEHWAFSGWGGDLTGSTSPTSITINGNKTVTALFVQSDFTLTATTVGSGTVVKNPDLAYYHVGQEVSVTATPAAGWSFASWSGDLTGSTNPGSIIMNSSKAVTATFTQDQYTLNVTVTGSGTVAKSPQQDTYIYGTAVTLTPTPATGWSFAGWTGACSGTGACVVTMTGNTSVGATFTENHYTLTTTVVGQGAIAKSPDQGTYTHGQVVTLTATPVTGWNFAGWSGACSGTSACELTMDGNKSVTATFTRIEYTLTLTMVGHGQLTADHDAPYYYGDTVILTAAATSGWTFVGFSGDAIGTTSPISITIDGNKSVTATFTEDWYTLTIEIDGHGTVGVNPVGPYRWHSMPVLTAYPDPGWTFVNWTGERVGTANPIEVTVNNNGVETAHFAPIPYTFTTSVVGSGTVSKSPDKATYTYGDAVTVTATPAAGWSFDHWSGSCTGNGPCVVTVDGNESVEATFVPGANTLDVTVVGSGMVTKTPDQGTYPTGATVSLSATPETGWEFTGWSGDVTSTDNPLTVTMDANKAITATFAQTVFDLNITAENGTVSVDPAGPYTYNTAVTLTAAPSDGYIFAGWSGDLTGTDNPAVVTMTTDKNITAGFAAIPCYVPRLVSQIEAANADPDATTIVLDDDCTYELTAVYAADPDGYGPVGLPPITTPVTLAGSNSTIARNATAAFRLFYVTTTGSLTIENVTLSNGLAEGGDGGHAYYDAGGGGAGMGGAIFNRGALTLANVTLTGNTAVGGKGGNDATITTTGGGGGGGMGGDGGPALATGGGSGGGINGGAGSICPAVPQSGGVGGGGGGGSAACYGGTGGAGGFGGGGGGNTNGGAGGFGGGGGGGQVGYNGTAGLGGFGGGAGAVWVGGGGAGFGGAIFNDEGTLTLTNTTFSSNTAQGGNGTLGTGATGGGGSGYGGAVFNRLGTYSVTNVTYDSNTVTAGTGGVAGRAVVADFYDWVQYTLTTSTTGTGSITLSSAGPYYNMDAVTLTATAGTGYTFSEWTGDLGGATNPASITLDGNKTVGATFTANPVTLAITQPPAGGTITADPAGPYHYGDVVTVSLAVDTGYDFTGWTGDLSGTTNPASLTLNGDKSVGASLTLQTVVLTIGTPAGGTITASPEGPYVYGQEVTLTAEPGAGYDFTGWTGDLSGTTSPATITMLGDKTVGATFELQTVTLTVDPATGGEIQVTPAGTYHYGDVVTVEAVAGTGYDFTGWTGDLSGTTDNPATLTLNGSKTIGATFGLETVTLTISDLTGGTITTSPAGPHLYGSVVTVTAVADLGHSFTGWTGDLSGTTNPTTITLDGSKTIGATFDLNVVNLTITPAEGGTITAAPEGPYHYGSTVTLQAAAGTGYDFVDWTGILSGAGNPTTITLYNDVAVSATFARQPVTLSIGTPVGGTISATPAGLYLYGDVVTVEATPEAGYTFTGWTGDLSGTTNPTTITLDGSKSIDATFELNVVTLIMEPVTGGTVNVSPAGIHHYGDTVTLDAVAAEGHTFTGWTGDCSGTELTCSLLMNGDKTVGATFAPNPVTLAITQPAAGGTITADPAGPYHYGDEVMVTLAVDTGYDFTGWTGDLSGTTNPATLTLNGDKSVGASLTLQTVVLTIGTPVGGTITADPVGPYHYGDQVVLTAAATAGYDFAGWTGDCSGTELTCSLLMNGDKTVGATFTLRPNTAPVLSEIGNQAAKASNPLTFTAAASDGDDPAQSLTYSLDAGAPSGAAIDAATGLFTWTPTAVQAPASYTITVTVTDSGTPALSDSETITIDVAEWSEDWEGYALGTVMHNVNNWAGWGSAIEAAAAVSDGQSLSAPQSLAVQGAVDQVHTYVGATSGKWVYTAWQYIPVDATGSPYFVMLNEYPYTANSSWSVQVMFDTSANTVSNQMGGGETLPLVKGRWVKLVEEIDLDLDVQRFYYDGQLLYQSSWTTSSMGTGVKNIGAVDLFANNSSAVYYDNLSLNRAQTLTTNVTGSGEITRSLNQTFYALNDVVELTAVPAAGWNFVEWTGACAGSGACSVTMDADKTVGATFAINTYTLTVEQSEHGAIDPVTDTYDYGTVVTLTATPADGYHFVEWTGACTGSGACSVTMDADKTVSATFAINTYTLTVEQSEHGAIDPVTDTYDYGTVVTLTTTPADGYHFVEWTGACTGSGACSVTMDADKTVGATFAINTYTLTVEQPEHGAIDPVTATYEHGTVVTLTATPAEGYHLVEWTGACAGSGACSVTMDGNKTVGATFAINTYTLTVEQPEHGAITPATNTYEHGTVVPLAATPAEGYHLVEWTGACTGSGACSVTMDGNKTVSATFAINTYTLTVEQPEHGTITPATATYEHGTVVPLTATPAEGYHLVAWTGTCTGSGACSVTMDANKTVSATFAINTFSITASAGTGGSIDPSGAVAVEFGADQTFSIVANTGSHVADVLVDGVSVGAVTSYTFNDVVASHTIEASFAIDTFIITASAGTGGSISPEGAVTVDYSADQTFTISPTTGYHVADVLVDGVSVGAVTSYTFNDVVASHTIEASFAVDTFTITASAGTGGSIDPSGAVPLAYGADQAFNITAGTGYHVADVLVDGVSVGAVDSYTFNNVVAHHTIAASFAIDTFTITASAGAGGSISPDGAVPLEYGAEQTFSIVANPGYHVLDVLVDGASVGTVTSYTFSAVTGNHTIAASFAINTYTINASAETGGSIDPSGDVTVEHGAVQAFNITTEPGYKVFDVLVDGASVGAVTSYTFSNVTTNHTIAASFTQEEYALSITQATGGTITAAPAGPYHLNDTVTVTAAPDENWSLTEWTGDCAGQGNPCTLTMDGIKTVSAVFTPTEYTEVYHLTGSRFGNGTLSLTITATPDVGWMFKEWRGDCQGEESPVCTIVLDGDKEIIAIFMPATYTLTVGTSEVGSGTVAVDPEKAVYHYDDQVALTAEANTAGGYTFTGWTGDEDELGQPMCDDASTTCTVTMRRNTEIIATFAGPAGQAQPSNQYVRSTQGSRETLVWVKKSTNNMAV